MRGLAICRRGNPGGISLGFSIFLIAAVILRFAVTVNASVGSVTVNWDIIGDILMAAGVLGLILVDDEPGSAAHDDQSAGARRIRRRTDLT